MRFITLLASGVILCHATSAFAASEKTVGIPLKDIWAFEMPGTKNVLKIKGPETDRLVAEIRQAISADESNPKGPRSAFAVEGVDGDALREVHAVIVERKKPRNAFPKGSLVSIVFFSKPAGSYVHLQQVESTENSIEIRYQFVPHRTRDVTQHLALIPFRTQSVNKIRVDIVQSPMAPEFTKWGIKPLRPDWAEEFISKPFTFEVVGD